MKHLILGGSGFIGRHVAFLLLREGHDVTIASRPRDPAFVSSWELEKAKWVPFDLATVDWPDLIADADVIHHLAWGTIPATANADPAADLVVNVGSTLGLLEASRKRSVPPRIVFASSGGTVYGKLQHVPVTEAHPMLPITAYGVGKSAVELYLAYYRSIHGVDCRIARIANPFGAGQDLARGQGAVTVFLNLALTGQPIEIWGDGEVIRDYIHVADVAEGIVRLGCHDDLAEHWTFNIASGHGISLNGILAEIEARLGHKLLVARKPGRAFDVPVSILDITLARDVLGWSPRMSFSDGVARTIAALKDTSGHPMKPALSRNLPYPVEGGLKGTSVV